ncbi:MAG: BrnT family toxin [Candidatus Levybacteria bacterium]|nr:BrnT family toxin [Candidatus Levybacteria bacterium]
MKVVEKAFEFEWDKGNIDKNFKKHNVSNREAEEVFFDEKRFIFRDKLHSSGEERLRIIGRTKEKRLLFVVFTKRGKKIRIISSRDINKREVYLYEEKINSSKV